MKIKLGFLIIALLVAITNLNAQDKAESDFDSELLGLPGDNLDLYAALNLFQKSKTIEEFEKSLNEEKTGINNLDLDADGEVDFIKVVTQKEDDDFAFVLQVDVNKDEIQDVAVIFVTKDKDGKVSIQIKGDEDLYGKDYVIEPKAETESVTANPAYSGPDTVVVKSEPSTVVVVESEPIVKYVYSPVYVPYYPPYYYGYYPPYYRPYPVVSINIYFGRNRYYRNHYYGGNRGGNTVIINNNNNTYNNYNRTRNTSNTVNRNKSEGKYKPNNAANRPSKNTKPSTRPTSKASTKPSTKPSSKPSTRPATKPATKPSARPATKPATKPSTRPSTKPANKPSTRPAARPNNKPAARPSSKQRGGGNGRRR
jgi:hypothetical protein